MDLQVSDTGYRLVGTHSEGLWYTLGFPSSGEYKNMILLIAYIRTS